jgi:hypothetical protein
MVTGGRERVNLGALSEVLNGEVTRKVQQKKINDTRPLLKAGRDH